MLRRIERRLCLAWPIPCVAKSCQLGVFCWVRVCNVACGCAQLHLCCVCGLVCVFVVSDMANYVDWHVTQPCFWDAKWHVDHDL